MVLNLLPRRQKFVFNQPVTAIVGPNGSGKSNTVEAIRFVLGEQSSKSLRSASGKDLIFAGSQHIPKMNRASVSLTFDNTSRVFHLHNVKNEKINVDFDEVVITRTVYADGTNTYHINGHDVRMKDIVELIASVHIGSSGHHIISQGEADRLLNASAKERKIMIEDALGLKLYQYRIKETEKKLSKAEDNVQELHALRRELAPHIKFLERQVKKIEQAEQLRGDLMLRYDTYLAQETILLEREHDTYRREYDALTAEHATLTAGLPENQAAGEIPEHQELATLRAELDVIQQQKNELVRSLGKIEGMLELAQSSKDQAEHPDAPTPSIRILFDDVKDLARTLEGYIDALERSESLQDMRTHAHAVRSTLHDFMRTYETEVPTIAEPDPALETKIQELQSLYASTKEALDTHIQQESGVHERMRMVRERIETHQQSQQEAQRAYYETKARIRDIESKMEMLALHHQATLRADQAFQEEINEGRALIGDRIDGYRESGVLDAGLHDQISRHSQEVLRKKLERLKIKLEEIGGGSGADVLAEYQETKERDAFLEREIQDVDMSIQSLKTLMQQLQHELAREFEGGLEKINTQFQEFFALMFGGGKAQLKSVDIIKRKRSESSEAEDDAESVLLDEEEPQETGIEIYVNLPRKKITHLEMLSGGERSLTSIALLFALSQVNPPPFLVLDETDAALDEANSRRYGDMIENLSRYSQLMVVTHNRETMSRAQVLYGVTIGNEECSQLLSVNFDDAAMFAK
ncbi:MAG: AAA family ATPase [Candidatus Pacebacteria bacterium]|nr:AAA family ATPase [Candidatus Paceibacterota bacterium]